MLMLLKSEKPNAELVRLLLSRETKNRGDPFVTSALRYALCLLFFKKQTKRKNYVGVLENFIFYCYKMDLKKRETYCSPLFV